MKAFLKSVTLLFAFSSVGATANAATIVEGFNKGNCSNETGLCDIYKIQIADDGAILTDSVINHGGGVTEHVEGDPTKGVLCSKRAMVPKPVYDAVMASMNQIALKTKINGGAAEYTKADKTMLLFYNTIMQQFANFDCRSTKQSN